MNNSTDADSGIRSHRWRTWLVAGVGLALFAVMAWVLHAQLAHLRIDEIFAAAFALPGWRIAAAVMSMVLSYLVVSGYDWLGLRWIRHRVSPSRVVLASVVSYAVSNNVGLAALGASAVRYHFYTKWGLNAVDVAQLVLFSTVSLWLGLMTLAGVTLIGSCLLGSASDAHPFVGIALLTVVAAYIVVCATRREPLTLGPWLLRLPTARLAFAQVAVGVADWFLAAVTLWWLVAVSDVSDTPGTAGLFDFLGAFSMAQAAGLISHVPGGLGVFESLLLARLHAPATAGLAGALVLYRGIYYLLPLLAVALHLVGREIVARRRGLTRLGARVATGVGSLVPAIASILVFVSGGVLLVSGSLPVAHGYLAAVEEWLPVPVVEASHLIGSATGVVLLILSRSLRWRVAAAFWSTVALLATGIAVSVLKGFDWQEALLLTVTLLALLPCRRRFSRRAAWSGPRASPAWMFSVLMVVVGAVGLGMFSYRHVEYSHDLWWQFELRADVARFLRASAAVSVVLLVFGFAQLLRLRPPAATPLTASERDALVEVARRNEDTNGMLVALGDKSALVSADGEAFLMYGAAGRSLVALGDPIGPPDRADELVWHFRERCDEQGARPVFYQVAATNLARYVDQGLTVLKLGEEAIVPLTGFSLEGSARKDLRRADRTLRESGCSFEVLPTGVDDQVLAELRAISDEWLAGVGGGKEKSFSVGYFADEYLRRFPIAVIRREGRLMAFANVWQAGGTEISVDLMRHRGDAPRSAMTWLFTELMTWGRYRGLARFNLGMAPLAGLHEGPLAPLWHRIGNLAFRHGSDFYRFAGLRDFKEKFDPVWEPRYLACPGGLALPGVLRDVVTLIHRGPPRVVS